MRVKCIKVPTDEFGNEGPLRLGDIYHVNDVHFKGEVLLGWTLNRDFYHLEEIPHPDMWFGEDCFDILTDELNTNKCQITEKQLEGANS